MEPIRRSDLVRATIAEVGAAGSLDVTVSQIAKRAGMSSALAHHYFGRKDQIFLAAMRQILSDYSAGVRGELVRARDHHQRVRAIIRASFAKSCFTQATINAWMTFYVRARNDAETRRLLSLYQRRLRSNLTHALRPLTDQPAQTAETLSALIDGFYIRAALAEPGFDAERTTLEALDKLIGRAA